MPTCPSYSRSSVDNNPSEWDLTLAPPVPDPEHVSSSARLEMDRHLPNVHALSSKLAKCKEDIEAWDDDLDFVSFEPIFEQLQFQQSGRLPRSPMSDASSNSATDYFQVQTTAAAATATAASLSPSTFTTIPTPIPTHTSTKIPSSSLVPALMNTPPTTPQTSPTVRRKSVGGTESHPHSAQKRVEALGTTIHVSSTSPVPSPFLFPATVTTTSSTTTATAPATPSSNPTSPLSLLSSSVSTSPASLTATVTTAVTTLPSLRIHRQNTLTASSSSSSGSLFATNFPPSDALPPLAPISPIVGKQSHPGPHSTGVATTATTPTPLTSSWLPKAPSSLGTSPPSSTSHSRHEDDNTVSTTSMTTITQEMMSSMATYSGVITRINPIRRVAAWVDDLDDLEVPEQDLDFNQVRTALAKSSLPETLEATEGWDTESESGSIANEDHFTADLRHPYSPLSPTPKALYGTSLPSSLPGAPLNGYVPPAKAQDAIETLEDAFDPHKFGSFKSTLDKRRKQATSPLAEAHPQISPLSLQANVHLDRDVHFQDEPEDFWEGIEIEDDQAFQHKGRNKNLVLRPNLQGRARSGSRVQREVVPLKDFVALPSRIPRLCRAPGDTSRAITPAPALSRTHSTHFDLPLRNLKSKSSLPRLKKQPSAIKREAKTSLSVSSSDGTFGNESVAIPPSPFVSRATTPISIQLNTGHRSSWHLGKDDLPSFKSSSLALRSVSFVEGSEAQPSSAQSSLSKASGSISKDPVPQDSATTYPLPTPVHHPGKSFATLRTMVKKWDWGRQKSVSRGHIPSFLSTSTTPPDDNSSIAEAVPSPTEFVKTTTNEAKTDGPSLSRSSSYSDWNPTGAGRDSRPPSRSATAVLEVQLSGLDVLDGVSSTGSVAEKFPKRFFLKRSLKQSSYGDGFELDQFDNLPTYQTREEAYQVQIQEMVQGRRQSVDRVTAWLRKPQSIANLKEMAKIEEQIEIPTEPEIPDSPKLRKSKSIRRSLFDIFGPNASDSAKSKKKRKALLAGPTLTPIHSQASVHKFSDSVHNPPQHVPWGNEGSIDEDYGEERTEYSEDRAATGKTHKFDFPVPPMPPSYYPTSPLLSATGVNRPALITNLGQFSKQRTQVSGKMMFDPVRMCWIFNPEYLARRRRRLGQRNNTEEDDIWGDEPDVFAGLSDDDSDKSEENYGDEEWDRPPSRNSSLRRSGAPWIAQRRLLHRPSFPRYPSQEFLKEDEDSQALENTKVPPTGPSVDGSDSRPGSMGVHSVVSKSSRRSLNVHGQGFCSNGIGSCGEFEVGIEFDITEDFLEQCIAAEAQHRKDAGKFFALPCSPPDERVPVASVTMSKILTLGKKSGKTSVASPEVPKEETPEGENAKPMLSWSGTLKSRSKSKAKSISKAGFTPTKEVVEGDSITLQLAPQELGSRRSSTTLGGLDSGVDFANKQDKRGKKKKNTDGKETIVLPSKSSKSSLKKNKKEPTAPFASFSSWSSSTNTTAPVSRSVATLAVRGRSGSRPKINTLQFDEQHCYSSLAREPLSFSATLAVARKGKYSSLGKRRIDAYTFDAPVVTSLAVINAGDHSSPMRGGIFRLRRIGSRRTVALPPDDSNESEEDLDDDEFDEDEYMDRGYRSMSNSRGRPPLRPRADLLFEFDKYASTRFHR